MRTTGSKTDAAKDGAPLPDSLADLNPAISEDAIAAHSVQSPPRHAPSTPEGLRAVMATIAKDAEHHQPMLNQYIPATILAEHSSRNRTQSVALNVMQRLLTTYHTYEQLKKDVIGNSLLTDDIKTADNFINHAEENIASTIKELEEKTRITQAVEEVMRTEREAKIREAKDSAEKAYKDNPEKVKASIDSKGHALANKGQSQKEIDDHYVRELTKEHVKEVTEQLNKLVAQAREQGDLTPEMENREAARVAKSHLTSQAQQQAFGHLLANHAMNLAVKIARIEEPFVNYSYWMNIHGKTPTEIRTALLDIFLDSKYPTDSARENAVMLFFSKAQEEKLSAAKAEKAKADEKAREEKAKATAKAQEEKAKATASTKTAAPAAFSFSISAVQSSKNDAPKANAITQVPPSKSNTASAFNNSELKDLADNIRQFRTVVNNAFTDTQRALNTRKNRRGYLDENLETFNTAFASAQYRAQETKAQEDGYKKEIDGFLQKANSLSQKIEALKVADPYEKLGTQRQAYDNVLNAHKFAQETVANSGCQTKLNELGRETKDITDSYSKDVTSWIRDARSFHDSSNKEDGEFSKAWIEKALAGEFFSATAKDSPREIKKASIIEDMKKRRDSLVKQYTTLKASLTSELPKSKGPASKISSLDGARTNDYQDLYALFAKLPDSPELDATIASLRLEADDPLLKLDNDGGVADLNKAIVELEEERGTLSHSLGPKRVALHKSNYALLDSALQSMIAHAKDSIFTSKIHHPEHKEKITTLAEEMKTSSNWLSIATKEIEKDHNSTILPEMLITVTEALRKMLVIKKITMAGPALYREILQDLQQKQDAGDLSLKGVDIIARAQKQAAAQLSKEVFATIQQHADDLATKKKQTETDLKTYVRDKFKADWQATLRSFNATIEGQLQRLQSAPLADAKAENNELKLTLTQSVASLASTPDSDSRAASPLAQQDSKKNELAAPAPAASPLFDYLTHLSDKAINKYVSDIYDNVNVEEARERDRLAAEAREAAAKRAADDEQKVTAQLSAPVPIVDLHAIEQAERSNDAAGRAAKSADNAHADVVRLVQVNSAEQPKPGGFLRGLAAAISFLIFPIASTYGGYLRLKEKGELTSSPLKNLFYSIGYGLLSLRYSWKRGISCIWSGDTTKYDRGTRPTQNVPEGLDMQPRPVHGGYTSSSHDAAPITAGAGHTSHIQGSLTKPPSSPIIPFVVPPEWAPIEQENHFKKGDQGNRFYKNASNKWLLREGEKSDFTLAFTPTMPDEKQQKEMTLDGLSALAFDPAKAEEVREHKLMPLNQHASRFMKQLLHLAFKLGRLDDITISPSRNFPTMFKIQIGKNVGNTFHINQDAANCDMVVTQFGDRENESGTVTNLSFKHSRRYTTEEQILLGAFFPPTRAAAASPVHDSPPASPLSGHLLPGMVPPRSDSPDAEAAASANTPPSSPGRTRSASPPPDAGAAAADTPHSSPRRIPGGGTSHR
jgi:hypothetical protein